MRLESTSADCAAPARTRGGDPFVPLLARDAKGWRISSNEGDIVERFGTDRLNDFYTATDPDFNGRGTSPTILDIETGKVVTNNYHLISTDLETAWAPLHAEGAPDLYPTPLRQEIDLLNQQLFDDINNGTYKIIFAGSRGAAQAAKIVFEARLADLEFRLTSRRYLFGEQLTDSDVRLFQTLSSFDRSYRPGIVDVFGEQATPRLEDFPVLWDYARDLFAQGFVDDRDLFFLGLLPGPSGEYIGKPLLGENKATIPAHEALARWKEPTTRSGLSGSPLYSGPGAGGSFELWRFGGY
jgi:Predicted glutathione S-transferase